MSRVTFLSVGGRVIVYEHQRKMSSNPAQNVIKIYFKGNLMGLMEQKKNFSTKVSRVTFLSVGGRVIVYEHQR